jgi:hypothetical protein
MGLLSFDRLIGTRGLLTLSFGGEKLGVQGDFADEAWGHG